MWMRKGLSDDPERERNSEVEGNVESLEERVYSCRSFVAHFLILCKNLI